MSVTIEDDDSATSAPNVKVTTGKPPSISIVEAAEPSGPTPEEALAQSRRAIEAAESSRRAAEQREQAAAAELTRMRASQQQDQQAVLASAVEASTAEQDRLAHAWQAASEAGDFPAAAKLLKDLTLASARLNQVTSELAMAKAGMQQRQQAAPQQQQNGVSQRSQQWIAEHPEFNRHKDALILKHQELINDGVMADTPAYFRGLDAEYDRLTGGGQRDQHGGNRRTEMQQDRRQQQTFDGAPPSRGNGGGSQSGTVKTLLGPVQVRSVNGQTLLQIPEHLRADFAEGAKVNRMSIEEYTMEQVKIARERDAGGNGGMIMNEGATYR